MLRGGNQMEAGTAQRGHVEAVRHVADIDLVIPAFNEEARIGETIATLHEVTSAASLDVRYIVVDNGCVDGTAEIVDRLDQSGVPVELISCQTAGKGAAVRAGILHASAPFVGFCDADRSTPPESVQQGLALLRAGWEVVIGSRRCTGAGYEVTQSVSRRLGSFAFHAMASRLTGPITDTQCGFKLFSIAAAQRLFSDTSLNGFAFDVEILARAQSSGYRMIEMPIRWTDAEGSTFRPVADGIRAFAELRAVRRALRRPPDPIGISA